MNKVWFITGCSTGFGRWLAKETLAQGYNVVVTARKPADVQDIVADYPDTAVALALDVTDTVQIKIAVAPLKKVKKRKYAICSRSMYLVWPR